MDTITFPVGPATRDMTAYGGPADGKKYPVVVLLHGNFGLGAPYGGQIRGFAQELAGLGYVAAVPHLYADAAPHPLDTDTGAHVPTLAAAVATVGGRPGADPSRVALVGYSLGAATCLAHLSAGPGRALAFADYFGFVPPGLAAGAANLPPTIIFHNPRDRIVGVDESKDLHALLGGAGVAREFHLLDDDNPEWYHAFKPGGTADTDSKARVVTWLNTYMPPTGA